MFDMHSSMLNQPHKHGSGKPARIQKSGVFCRSAFRHERFKRGVEASPLLLSMGRPLVGPSHRERCCAPCTAEFSRVATKTWWRRLHGFEGSTSYPLMTFGTDFNGDTCAGCSLRDACDPDVHQLRSDASSFQPLPLFGVNFFTCRGKRTSKPSKFCSICEHGIRCVDHAMIRFRKTA